MEEIEDLEFRLTEEELKGAEGFYAKLKDADLSNVKKVLDSVHKVASEFFESGIKYMGYDFYESGENQSVFFTLFLIGGQLTKEGERPDIDLMFATNSEYTSGFSDPKSSPRLKDRWEPMEIEGELPNSYMSGDTDGKVLIRLTPEIGKKIDLVHMRRWPSYDGQGYNSEGEFIEKDVDTDGKQLPRVALYRNSVDLVSQMRSSMNRSSHSGTGMI